MGGMANGAVGMLEPPIATHLMFPFDEVEGNLLINQILGSGNTRRPRTNDAVF